MTPVRNKRTYKGPGIYIGRPSKWGNPFVISEKMPREKAIEKYTTWLLGKIASGEITLEELAALSGHTLICWCHPLPCHGDVLAEFADQAKRELDEAICHLTNP